nr:extensin-like [Odocoileus virginianus texanus]
MEGFPEPGPPASTPTACQSQRPHLSPTRSLSWPPSAPSPGALSPGGGRLGRQPPVRAGGQPANKSYQGSLCAPSQLTFDSTAPPYPLTSPPVPCPITLHPLTVHPHPTPLPAPLTLHPSTPHPFHPAPPHPAPPHSAPVAQGQALVGMPPEILGELQPHLLGHPSSLSHDRDPPGQAYAPRAGSRAEPP